MNLPYKNSPIEGLPAKMVSVAPVSVAGNAGATVIASFTIPPFASFFEALVLGHDATAKESAVYLVRLAVKNLPGRAAKATGTLTSSGNFTDGQTVTIGSKVYTFQTTLTNVDGNVLIGADRTASHLNLKKAINLEAGAGTNYATAMTLHPTVTATSATATTTVVEAKAAGTAGNSIASTETQSNAAWGGATLTGGLDPQVAIGSVNATFTAEDDASWTATMAVNGPSGTVELSVTPDGTNATSFSAYVTITTLG